MSSWDLAIEMIGQVPQQWELLYFIGAFIVFLMKCILVLSPVLIVYIAVGKGR
ncbi:MAG: hypothetical protein PHU05_02285 [Bacilli bacterium]|nr:hypothetical protein [Bacilli bacterium]